MRISDWSSDVCSSDLVVSHSGFAFEGGPALPAAMRPDYMASFMGNFYEGISLFFLPYPVEPRPFLLTLNAGEKKGVLALEPYDFDYKGGPRLPDRYRPYVAGSPYLRCRCRRGKGGGETGRASRRVRGRQYV